MRRTVWAPLFLLLISARPQDRAASIDAVALEKGLSQNEHGIHFLVDFSVTGCEGKSCLVQVFFYDKDKNALLDKNGEYATESGKVSVWASFKPAFETARYAGYRLFIPYNEFHLKPGSYDLFYAVHVFVREGDQWVALAKTGYRGMSFSWKIEESGELTSVDVRQDATGVEFTVSASVHGMLGRDGSIEVHFYHDYYAQRYVFRNGSREAGALAAKIEIKPDYVDANYKNRTFFVPTKDFPLKIGKNVFYFKVWIIAVSSNSERYALDATLSKAITIKNGSLALEEAWVIDRIDVLLDWDEPEEGADMKRIKECLAEFDGRLYDATDGQIRVASFRIRRARGAHDHDLPVLRFYRDFEKGDHGSTTEKTKKFIREHRSFANYGAPDRPRDAHLSMGLLRDRGVKTYAGSVCHEFFHAWFGLRDEYAEIEEKGTGRKTFQSLCAKDEALRNAYNACIMGSSSPWNRELCSPDTHNTDDETGTLRKTDCYTQLKETLKKSLGRNLVVPETPVAGPETAPAPKIIVDMD